MDAPTPPLEPMYNLATVVAMVPFVHIGALRDFLHKHRDRFPRRTIAVGGRQQRMLLASEVATIRALRLRHYPVAASRRYIKTALA